MDECLDLWVLEFGIRVEDSFHVPFLLLRFPADPYDRGIQREETVSIP